MIFFAVLVIDSFLNCVHTKKVKVLEKVIQRVGYRGSSRDHNVVIGPCVRCSFYKKDAGASNRHCQAHLRVWYRHSHAEVYRLLHG